LLKQHVERQGEADDEEKEDKEKFAKGSKDVREHDHEDAEEGELLDEEEQVQPGEEDRCSSYLPLPGL
jgi:hypothetical protein